jgi:hypothetical protein
MNYIKINSINKIYLNRNNINYIILELNRILRKIRKTIKIIIDLNLEYKNKTIKCPKIFQEK